jgi:hypothetical protein
MSNEFIAELRKWAAEVVRSNASGDVAGMHRAVELISKHFVVQPHEVAILVAMPDDRFLRFVLPENLQGMGQIPLTSANSLAVRTAREKRPEMINHFSAIPHTTVFEAVPISEDRRDSGFAQRCLAIRRWRGLRHTTASRAENRRRYHRPLHPPLRQGV